MGKFVVALLFAMLTLAVVFAVDYEGDRCEISTFSFGTQGSCDDNCQCLEVGDCDYSASGSQNRGKICTSKDQKVHICVGTAGTSGCRDPKSQIHTGEFDDLVEWTQINQSVYSYRKL